MILPSGLGLGMPHQNAENNPEWYDTTLETFNPSWWYNWKYDQLDYDDYVPMVWKCNNDWIMRALPTIQENKNKLWLIGNEPDLYSQSNTEPQEFAEAVNELKRQVRGVTIALPGIHWDRYKYGERWMDEYVSYGGPIPDVWHVHLYRGSAWEWGNSCPEMLAYLNGIADIPIIISECASGHPLTVAEVLRAIQGTVISGDIQAACYFSAYYDRWPEPSLLTPTGELTEAGEIYVAGRQTIHLPLVMNT